MVLLNKFTDFFWVSSESEVCLVPTFNDYFRILRLALHASSVRFHRHSVVSRKHSFKLCCPHHWIYNCMLFFNLILKSHGDRVLAISLLYVEFLIIPGHLSTEIFSFFHPTNVTRSYPLPLFGQHGKGRLVSLSRTSNFFCSKSILGVLSIWMSDVMSPIGVAFAIFSTPYRFHWVRLGFLSYFLGSFIRYYSWVLGNIFLLWMPSLSMEKVVSRSRKDLLTFLTWVRACYSLHRLPLLVVLQVGIGVLLKAMRLRV
jgi:hypothetical protein